MKQGPHPAGADLLRLSNGNVLSSLGTNAYAMTPQTFERLRTLAYELEQLMPQLQVLNGTIGMGATPGTAGAASANIGRLPDI